MTKNKNILLCGVGNILMTDEGIGVHLINEIEKQNIVPENVEIMDGGTLGFALIPYFCNREKLIIVDAVKVKGEEGELYRFCPDNIKESKATPISFHDLGILDVIRTMKMQDANVPKEIVIFGINVRNMDLGTELTETIKNKIEVYIKEILKELV
ncbi:MAG: HyaD/HybD family hydrogenase maturation endopeptidase [Pseudomonadota bacterium]